MKIAHILGVFLFLGISSALSYTRLPPKFPPPCNLSCPSVYDPICGMRQDKDGTWIGRKFSNKCQMDIANLCFGGQYIECDGREYFSAI